MSETRATEPIHMKGESQKNNWKLHQQIPFQKMLSRKKKSKEKQLYLESTGTNVARVNDQGQVIIWSS